MKKLRVGVIGVGGIASDHHLPHWHSSPNAELSAFCDVNAERLECEADKYDVTRRLADWRELVALSDLDVIDIAAPNALHAPASIAALEAGKHVLCEKPMATNAADAYRMLEASRRADRLLMINHHFRFSRSALELKRFATEEHFGRPYFAHCRWHRRRRVPIAPTFIDPELSGGGPMLDIGVHVIDLAMHLMGYPKVESVTGSLGTYLAHRKDLGGDWGDWNPEKFGVEDFASAYFRLAGGATLFVETSWLGFHEKPEEWSVSVLGTRAGLHWPQGVVISETDKIPTELKLSGSPTVSPYQETIWRFIDAVLYHKPAPIPPEESFAVVRMLDGVYRSSSTGRECRFE